MTLALPTRPSHHRRLPSAQDKPQYLLPFYRHNTAPRNMNGLDQWFHDPVAWADWMQSMQSDRAHCEQQPGNKGAEPQTEPRMLSPSTRQESSTLQDIQVLDEVGRSSRVDQVSTSGDVPGSAALFLQAQRHLRSTKPLATYLGTICATCDAPLDLSEQKNQIIRPHIQCSLNQEPGHLAIKCHEISCWEIFKTLDELREHWHSNEVCTFPGCAQRVSDASSHYSFTHPWTFHCKQCNEVFDFQSDLDDHGAKLMHSAYICGFPDCGSPSARMGELIRHQKIHQANAIRFSCPHCRKYRGKNGFKRKDHLRQHIIGFHHIMTDSTEATDALHACPRDGCEKVGTDAFTTKKLLAVHLKRDHPSPFQCPERGCDRVGTKGWMRESDMVKHIAKVHPMPSLLEAPNAANQFDFDLGFGGGNF